MYEQIFRPETFLIFRFGKLLIFRFGKFFDFSICKFFDFPFSANLPNYVLFDKAYIFVGKIRVNVWIFLSYWQKCVYYTVYYYTKWHAMKLSIRLFSNSSIACFLHTSHAYDRCPSVCSAEFIYNKTLIECKHIIDRPIGIDLAALFASVR